MNLITTIATAILAIFTGIYVWLTYRILKANKDLLLEHTRPFVVVSLPVKNSELLLSIKNVGKRPAYNIKVRFEPSIESVVPEGVNRDELKRFQEQPFLPPDTEFSHIINITTGGTIPQGFDKSFTIEVIYTDITRKKIYTEQYSINVANYLMYLSKTRDDNYDLIKNILRLIETISKDSEKLIKKMDEMKNTIKDLKNKSHWR